MNKPPRNNLLKCVSGSAFSCNDVIDGWMASVLSGREFGKVNSEELAMDRRCACCSPWALGGQT